MGSAIGQNEHRVGEVPIGLNDVEQCPFIRASTRSGGATGSDELLERASHERFSVSGFVDGRLDDHAVERVAFGVEAEHAVVADAPPHAVRC